MSYEIDLCSVDRIKGEIKKKIDTDIHEKIPQSKIEEFTAKDQQWVLEKQLKNSAWFRKPKKHDSLFRDKVWAMCASLGFQILNYGDSFDIPYGDKEDEYRQFDVLAVDEDVVLVFSCCSSAAERPRSFTFKDEIEVVKACRAGLNGSLTQQFPDRKIKLLVAANNFNVSDETLNRFADAGMAYLDEDAVDYYLELSRQVGYAAKFQLLGNVFRGQKIAAMNVAVPAIRGKMGGLVYYSFAIEPARLLKISYVLHRNKANTIWMPTYQRIIKRSRLNKISSFVEKGGFFPNSLIININNGGKPLRFDKDSQQCGNTKLGLLYLPQKYQSAYIIDGQHRLYGYANSIRAESDLIPVVAFVDMPGADQVKMFMDINENQQSVPKNLRLTLEADLEWENPDKKRQARALKLKIAQTLGEGKSSPLRGRIILGEEKANERLCISLDAINRGLERGGFIGELSSSDTKKQGSFYRGNIDETIKPLFSFLELCFAYLRDELPQQWDLGRAESGFIFTNAGIEAVLRLFGDFINYSTGKHAINPVTETAEAVFEKIQPLLMYFTEFVRSLSLNQITELRTHLGSGAPVRYLREFESAIIARVDDFDPIGYNEWKSSQETKFNSGSFVIVRSIEEFLKKDIRTKLENKYGEEWFRRGVPKPVYESATSMAATKQYEAEAGTTIDWWDCLYIIDYKKILEFGKMTVWNELFNDVYTLPSDKKSNWKDKMRWFDELNDIRNKVSHSGNVTEDEYLFLKKIKSQLGILDVSDVDS
ncbi:MAG: DGQHR domain-containing protein [Bifidobacterium sp.]|jgi:DNA sulfur modification protein DndB|nr:DGQHR domain-containing protein [Bifidobacterium sp.]